MKNQETKDLEELEALKLEAAEKGITVHPNIGLSKLKEKLGIIQSPSNIPPSTPPKENKNIVGKTESGEAIYSKEYFEVRMIADFNKLMQRQRPVYCEKFDIKKAKFIFHFTDRTEAFIGRFARSLTSWVLAQELSIDKIISSDCSFTEKMITVFSTRSPKPLTRMQKERLKQEELERRGY